jgi:hypothetical protein
MLVRLLSRSHKATREATATAAAKAPPTLTASAAGGPAQPVPQRFCSSFRLLFPLSFDSPSLPSSTFHGRRQGSSKVAGGAAPSSRTRDLRPTAPDLQPPGAGGARWLGAVADPLWPMAEFGARRGSLRGHLPHGSAAPRVEPCNAGGWAVRPPVAPRHLCSSRPLHGLLLDAVAGPSLRQRRLAPHRSRRPYSSPSPRVTGVSLVLLSKLSDGAADITAECACKVAVPPSKCCRRGWEASTAAGGAWLGAPFARSGASARRFGAAPPHPPCFPMCVHRLLLVLHLVSVVVA